MIRRTLAASLVAAVLMPLGPAATAADQRPDLVPATATPDKALEKGTVVNLGNAKGPELYIVQLDKPAVPTRSLGGEKGAAIEKSASDYEETLVSDQARLTKAIERITGGEAEVRFRYTQAINGVAVELTREQARRVADLDDVAAVHVDFTRQLQTDNGPEWIGAPTIWDGTNVPGEVGSEGEGVIVGILDTGLNPANPSFADVVPVSEGGDGYDHTNPWGAGTYVGVCDPEDPSYVADWGCNDKLIGYWNFQDNGDDYDDDGHGSHTGSTTAGNRVTATAYSAKGTDNEFSVTRDIKGVAPHANIVGYDVCDGAGCQGTSILAAIEQSIEDGIDVINYSIGSEAPSSPWSDPDAVAFLNAREAGIHVATSAGNAGPGVETIGGPGDVPWMTTVGATTHDRKYVASVTDLAADGGATLPAIEGTGLSGPTDGSFPIVYAGDLGSPLCKAGELAGQDLTGKIVVCDRGETGRVEKGEVVEALGAEGMVLANDVNSGDSLNGDAHALPAAHITYDDGVTLKQWMASVTGETAALSGSVKLEGAEYADIMAAFSSRGPNRAVSMISPSVSAPGVDILAAAGTENSTEWHFISGTSMASPHTAGALALLDAVQPDWTPAEAQSALMTTAFRDITDSDGTEADWHDMGSGRIDLTKAAKAGLLLDETIAGYEGADPSAGGDVRTLNIASMADNECLQSCSWTRTFEGTATGVGEWTATVENLSDDVTLSLDKGAFSVTEGGTADLTVTAEIASGADLDTWLYGTVVLTPPAGSDAPAAHLPVAVLPSAGVLPSSVDVITRRDAGSQVAQDLEAIEITDLQIEASGLVPESRKELSVVEDDTNTDPYDGNGTVVERITVPEGATSMMVALENATAPDFDLFVGQGEVGPEGEVANSASAGSNEKVEIANPAAGEWWVVVQNWEASEPGGTDTTDLVSAVVAGDAGNLSAEGPAGPVPAATPFDLRVFYDEAELDAGETWHGALTLGSGPGKAGDIGVVPVTVSRVADDVTKTADVEKAAPGEVITYTVEVAPNVAPEDLAYTIEDALPAGTSYVEGSATNGATYADGKVTWSGTMESTYGLEGSYSITTSNTDPSCQTPFGPGYVDLADSDISPQAGVTGDTTTFTAFSDLPFSFYGQTQQGLTFSDDGFLVYGAENYAGSPWIPQSVPNAAAPNNVAALLWQDMEFRHDAATGAGVSLATAGDIAVIEYDDMRLWGDEAGAGGSLDMQVFALAGSNHLVFAYDNVTAGPILQGATIGVENADGDAAAALVNAGDASTVVEDGLNVCVTYESAEGEPVEFSYQVSVDEDVHNRQRLVNEAVHTVDNPGAKPASATSTVVVEGAKERTEVGLAVDPNRFDAGGTTAATATVFSAGESVATGQVEFWVGNRMAGTATVGADGRATATLGGFTTAGTFPVTAKYLGDAANLPSTSAPVNVVVMTPEQPMPKVGSTVTAIAPKVIRTGKKAKVKVIVSASKVTPTGWVKVKVNGPGKKAKVFKVELNRKGMAKIKLPKFKKAGKIKVKIKYLGDAAVKRSKDKVTIRVVKKKRRR